MRQPNPRDGAEDGVGALAMQQGLAGGVGGEAPQLKGSVSNRSLYETFFGPPPNPQAGDADKLVNVDGDRQALDLPQAWEGKNAVFSGMIMSVISKAEADIVKHFLPYAKPPSGQGYTFEWEQIIADDHILARLPDEAVPPVVSSRREKFRTHMQQSGLGFIVERGFMLTERGRRMYDMNIAQIRDGALRRLILGCTRALLEAGARSSRDFANAVNHNVEAQSPMESHRWWVATFGILNRDPMGISYLTEVASRILKSRGFNLTAILLPPNGRSFLRTITARRELEVGGLMPGWDRDVVKSAVHLLEDDQNISVYQVSPMTVRTSEQQMNTLSRVRAIGQHWLMGAERMPVDASEYDGRSSAIEIYDADQDRMQPIRLDDGIRYSVRWNRALPVTEDAGLDPASHQNVTRAMANNPAVKDTFCYRDHTGRAHVAKVLGELPEHGLPDEDFERIAETGAARLRKALGQHAEAIEEMGETGSLGDEPSRKRLLRVVRRLFPHSHYVHASSHDVDGVWGWLSQQGHVGQTGQLHTGARITRADTLNIQAQDLKSQLERLLPQDNIGEVASYMNNGAVREYLAKVNDQINSVIEKSGGTPGSLARAPVFQGDAATLASTIKQYARDLITLVHTIVDRVPDDADSVLRSATHNIGQVHSLAGQDGPERITAKLRELWGAAKRALEQHEGRGQHLAAEQFLQEEDAQQLHRRKVLAADFTPLERVAAFAWLSTRISRHALCKLVEHNIQPGVNVLLFRPWERFEMGAGIFCQAGSSLGATFIGRTSFTLQDDAGRGMLFGAFKCYHRSVVLNDRGIVVVPDILIRRYDGGAGTKFITFIGRAPGRRRAGESYFDPAKRIATGDLIAELVPMTMVRTPAIMDITGWHHNPAKCKQREEDYHATFMRNILTLGRATSQMPPSSMAEWQRMALNTTTCSGTARGFNPVQGAYTKPIEGNGPWARLQYPGGVNMMCATRQAATQKRFQGNDTLVTDNVPL